MKQCSSALANELNTSSEFLCCDLFELELASGSVYYIADFDTDVTYNNHVFSHDLFIMERNQTKVTGEPTTDSLSIVVRTDKNHSDIIDGKNFMLAAHDGSLDNAYITLTRAFFNKSSMALLGGIDLFRGRTEVSSCGGISCQLNCKSECTGLNGVIPLRIFAPQNVYITDGTSVVTSSTDKYTCMVPLKPSKNVLLRL